MSSIQFQLHDKALRAEWGNGQLVQRVTFRLQLANGESLITAEGAPITNGFVEFSSELPRFDAPILRFVPEHTDPDTGKITGPTASFYAVISGGLADKLLAAPPEARIELNVSTELMGAIQFNDSLGFQKKWDTAASVQVPVQFFGINIVYPTGSPK